MLNFTMSQKFDCSPFAFHQPRFYERRWVHHAALVELCLVAPQDFIGETTGKTTWKNILAQGPTQDITLGESEVLVLPVFMIHTILKRQKMYLPEA